MKYSRLRRYTLVAVHAGLALLMLSSCTSTHTFKALPLSVQSLHAIDSVCMLQMQSGHFPGLAVSVTEGHQRAWSKGYGYSNLEKKKPVDPADDLFRIGSVSKTVTASALARLTERGAIDLDVPISTYDKDLPGDKGLLTLRQIGGHLAGIRHYTGSEFLSNIHYHNLSDPLEVFIHDSLLFDVGTKYQYSTYGWTLISAVMEQAVHEPFLDIIHHEVSDPLHLTDLKADQTDSTQYHRVTFYEYQNGSHVKSPEVDNSNKWAGGGLICSADDLARYGFALVKPGFLRKKTIEAFTQSQMTTSGEKTNYGIGFASGTDDSKRNWFGHSGGSIGGTSMMLIYPDQDLVVVTLVNQGSASMDGLAWKIADIIMKGER